MFSLEQISNWLVAGAGALFLGVLSIGVSYVRDIGKRMQEIADKMTGLVAKDQVHDERHSDVDERLEDHEQRIRFIEVRH